MPFAPNTNRFDYVLLLSVLGILGLGLLTLYSVNTDFFFRQLIWASLALALVVLGGFFRFSWFRVQSWFRYGLYMLSVALVLVAHFQETVVRGTKGWIHIGGFQFEPAELVKVSLVLLLAHFFSRRHIEAWTNGNLLLSLLYAALPAAIIALHPDFGSATVIMMLWLCFLLFSGINLKRLLLGASLFIIFCGVLWVSFLKPYQKERILGFLEPSYDPLGANYNVIQSKIAIGSAGFFGKGMNSGTQTQFNFLPESHSDFIFAAFVEEWGFLGGSVLVGLFLLLISRIVKSGLSAENNEARFISLGAAAIFLAQFLINVGSNLGIVPVTGLTLPFFSYGGSSVLTSALLIAIIQSNKVDSSR